MHARILSVTSALDSAGSFPLLDAILSGKTLKLDFRRSPSMADVHENAFLRVFRKALAQNWCLQPYCTTCGAREFRFALREVGGELGGPLADALADVSLDELTSLPKWDGAVEIAVRDLPFSGSVLECWLARADENLRFFDFVLYKLVRYLPEGHPLRTKWVTQALSLATQTRDFSLTESLILTLRESAFAHNDLIEIAKELARESSQMRRVLRNACKIDISSA